jgi:predicted aspartyl protease
MKNTNKNIFTLRINNKTTLEFFNDLLNTKVFESANVLLNKILDTGIQGFVKTYLRKDVFTSLQEKPPERKDVFTADMKQIKATTEDTYVILTTLERLLSALYNIKVSELSGENVSPDEVTSGILSDLPPEFQTVKDEVVRLRAGRANR